jgi:hypothetical protein
MPFKFRTPSVKVAGVRVRLGKQGVSTSVKVGRTTLTKGPKGTRATTNMGFGLSHQTKLSGKAHEKASSPRKRRWWLLWLA